MTDQNIRTIMLDTETTGLEPGPLKEDGDRLLEIGAVEYINNRATGRHLHLYIDPGREVPEDAVKVHGITREEAINAGGGQKFRHVIDELLAFVKDATVVIHNAPFDLGFLNNEMEELNKGKFENHCQIIDSLKVAQAKYPGKMNNLDALARRLGIDNSDREQSGLHGALIDCYLLGGVYASMMLQQHSLIKDVKGFVQEAGRRLDVNYIEDPRALQLPVITASKDEANDHNQMIGRISKKSAPKWESLSPSM